MAAPTPPQKADHWSAQDYKAAANFVHKLTKTVLIYLDPQPTDTILDIGCGDGPLTAQIAALTPQGSVHGLDSSPNFITHALATHASKSANLTFELQDCSALSAWAAQHAAQYDKVFSNAALHWILRDPTRRAPTLRALFDVLKPGGRLVVELGGAGNVAEMQTALVAALVHQGLDPEEAQEASPWFFPSEVLMQQLLSEVGFEVERAELEYRPTRMEEGEGGGVEGWVRLMGQVFLEKVEAGSREEVVRQVVQAARPTCVRPEGGEWLGYVRCRAVARKPL